MTRRQFSDAEVASIQAEFPISRTADLAAKLGRTYRSIACFANSRGLLKDPEFLRAVGDSRAVGVGLNCLLGAGAPERAIVFCVTQFFCLTP